MYDTSRCTGRQGLFGWKRDERLRTLTVRIGLVYELVFIVVQIIETLFSLLRIDNEFRHIPERDGIEVDHRIRVSHRLYE